MHPTPSCRHDLAPAPHHHTADGRGAAVHSTTPRLLVDTLPPIPAPHHHPPQMDVVQQECLARDARRLSLPSPAVPVDAASCPVSRSYSMCVEHVMSCDRCGQTSSNSETTTEIRREMLVGMSASMSVNMSASHAWTLRIKLCRDHHGDQARDGVR